MLNKKVNQSSYDLQLLIKIKIAMPCFFKTSIQQSPIHGKGVFALEDIPEGTIWWRFVGNQKQIPIEHIAPLPNYVLSKQQLLAVKDEKELTMILFYGFYDEYAQRYLVIRDGSQFLNHSETPNSKLIFKKEDLANICSKTLRKINAGEQLFENYYQFGGLDQNWLTQLYEKYVPSALQLDNYKKTQI